MELMTNNDKDVILVQRNTNPELNKDKKINETFYKIFKDILKEMKNIIHKNNDEIKNELNEIIIPIIKSLSLTYTPYILIIYTILFLILCISIVNLILISRYILK